MAGIDLPVRAIREQVAARHRPHRAPDPASRTARRRITAHHRGRRAWRATSSPCRTSSSSTTRPASTSTAGTSAACVPPDCGPKFTTHLANQGVELPAGGLLPRRRTVISVTPVWLWATAGAVFVGLMTITLVVLSPVFTSASRRRIQAIELYLGTPAPDRTADDRAESQGTVGTGLVRISERLTRGRDGTAKAALLIERADLPLRTSEWYVLRGLAVLVGLMGGWFLLRGAGAFVLLGLLPGRGSAWPCRPWCSRCSPPDGPGSSSSSSPTC